MRSRKARSCETTTTAPSNAREKRLEPREPGEVEVVRRLVEQEHVEAAEQDRGERGARRLAAGEPSERPVELRVEPELRQHLLRARLEVAAAAGEERVERLGVRVGLLGLVGEARGERVHRALGLGDAGAAREIRAERLAGAAGRAPAAG